MQPVNPNYRDAVKWVVEDAAFVTDVGIRLVDVGPGWCETEMPVLPRHYQHSDYIHAGVQATIADHTAGAAGTTLVGEDEYVLSANISLSLLRPAHGDLLRCRATVLKPGRKLIVAESEVFAVQQDQSRLVSKATVTLAVLPRPK
jgi:uncharacterized protein (TIGR00369 family)